MKIFISVPMRGRTDEEIAEAIENAKGELVIMGSENNETVEYVDNFVNPPLDEGVKNDPMWCLGGAIQKMSTCDAIYFCPGWDTARGCLIEKVVASVYGLMRLYKDEAGVIYQESVEE